MRGIRKKSRSIVSYISSYYFLCLVLLAVFMVVSMQLMLDALVRYDIKNTIEKELRRNRKCIHVSDGNISMDEDFVFKRDGFYFQIVDKDGLLQYGKYQKNLKGQIIPVNFKKVRQVKANRKVYYVLDRTLVKGKYYLRCVVSRDKVSGSYRYARYFTMAWALLVLLLAVLIQILLKRRLQKPVHQIVDQASKIGNDKNLAARINYDGNLYELQMLSDANNRMLDQIAEMFREQKQFSSDLAHELKTPITVLKAQVHDINKHIADERQVREGLTVLDRQADRMSRIISQMLHLSRLDQGRVILDPEQMDIREIVDSVCEDLEIRGEKSISFVVTAAHRELTMDISLMTIVIQNLIENAVKYSDENKTVWISSEAQEGFYHLVVRDEGCGIAAEHQEHIFERFYRVEKTGEVEGFGLGLPLALQIARMHGGTITVESTPGKGSTFTLQLNDEKET